MLACRGLETKLKHCLVGSNIFANETEGIDPKQQVRNHSCHTAPASYCGPDVRWLASLYLVTLLALLWAAKVKTSPVKLGRVQLQSRGSDTDGF